MSTNANFGWAPPKKEPKKWTCTDFALHVHGVLWTHGAVSYVDVCGCEGSHI
jgi:hypothetical protein